MHNPRQIFFVPSRIQGVEIVYNSGQMHQDAGRLFRYPANQSEDASFETDVVFLYNMPDLPRIVEQYRGDWFHHSIERLSSDRFNLSCLLYAPKDGP